jgi:hypothetical protein
MRRAMLLVLMCMVFITTVVVESASAGEGKRRIYEGSLSNGYRIGIQLFLQEDEAPALSVFEFGVDMTRVTMSRLR